MSDLVDQLLDRVWGIVRKRRVPQVQRLPCPICGRTVPALRDGRLVKHHYKGTGVWCLGGLPAAKLPAAHHEGEGEGDDFMESLLTDPDEGDRG